MAKHICLYDVAPLLSQSDYEMSKHKLQRHLYRTQSTLPIKLENHLYKRNTEGIRDEIPVTPTSTTDIRELRDQVDCLSRRITVTDLEEKLWQTRVTYPKSQGR